jgi:hypothetical protein
VIETQADGAVSLDTQDLRVRYAELQAPPIRCPMQRPGRRGPRDRAVADQLGSIPDLCDEVDRLRAALTVARRDHQDLVAAARATLAAAADGETNPLYYLRDELGNRGLLAARRGEQPW